MRQRDLQFTFSVLTAQVAFEVVEFTLEEALSEPFRLTLELASDNGAIDFGQILDQPALLTIWQGGLQVRHVHGLVSSFTQGKTGFRRTRYRLLVEPQLARLALSSDWRIFQQKTVPEILKSVLDEHGVLDYQPYIHTPHAPREYCVQAGDTDLYLFDRMSTEEGLFYFFKHDANAHTLVQGDKLYVHPTTANPQRSGARPGAWRQRRVAAEQRRQPGHRPEWPGGYPPHPQQRICPPTRPLPQVPRPLRARAGSSSLATSSHPAAMPVIRLCAPTHRHPPPLPPPSRLQLFA